MPSLDLTPVNLFLGFILLCASPFIMLALPLLIVPLLSLYLLYYLFYPLTPKKSPQRSKEVGTAKPGETAPRRWATHTEMVTRWDDRIETIPELISQAAERYASRPALGVRRTIKVEEKRSTQHVDGKEVEKVLKTPWMSDYEWRTYSQMYDEIKRFGAGLLAFDLQHGQRIALFANTRPEWQIAAQGCFAQGLPVVTVYPSLGVDALAYSLNQASVQHIITQADKLDLVIQTASVVSSLKYVIFFDELSNAKRAEYEAKSRLKFISYAQVLTAGTGQPSRTAAPVKGSDIAVIMYTSGSTGNPKGVLITHKNLLAAGWGVTYVPPQPLTHEDTYIAFLPLAHVLELTAETVFLGIGARIGYGSPLTLNDNGAKNAEGKPCGDLTALRPTLMAAVPLILDRLKAAVTEQVKKSNIVARTVFQVAFYLKYRNWMRKESSPILDRLVFSKIAAKMGGRVRLLLSGGAPLSKDTQSIHQRRLLRAGAAGLRTDRDTGGQLYLPSRRRTAGQCHPGAPLPACEIKLVDVPEMGYLSTDKDKDGKPAPRGEICIRGGCVAPGYFDLPDQTAEVFEKGKGKVRIRLTATPQQPTACMPATCCCCCSAHTVRLRAGCVL